MGLDTRLDGSELNIDVMMISRIDLVQNTIRTMSLPRDFYVEIPGIGSDFDKWPDLLGISRDLVITNIPVDVQLEIMAAVSELSAADVYW